MLNRCIRLHDSLSWPLINSLINLGRLVRGSGCREASAGHTKYNIHNSITTYTYLLPMFVSVITISVHGREQGRLTGPASEAEQTWSASQACRSDKKRSGWADPENKYTGLPNYYGPILWETTVLTTSSKMKTT